MDHWSNNSDYPIRDMDIELKSTPKGAVHDHRGILRLRISCGIGLCISATKYMR